MDSSWDLIIVGAGLAGTSCAWHLARQERSRILLLERETLAGTQATAQNAAMIRALCGVPGLAEHAEAGQAWWNALPLDLGIPHAFQQVGSLLLVSKSDSLAKIAAEVLSARQRGLDCRMLTPAEVTGRYPLLADCPILGAAWTASDGIADPSAVNEAWLSGARRLGVQVELDQDVSRLRVEAGRVTGVVLADGSTLRAARVLVAAGAWAGQLLSSSGLPDQGIQPHRRHLFCTVEDPRIEEDHPFVWHLDLDAYFRAESGGFLFSACDETRVPPGPAETDPDIESFAHGRLEAVFPFLMDLPLKRHWAGLRTFRPGALFLLGEDDETPGLWQASGLGGHGVTCAPSIGRHIARLWADQPASEEASTAPGGRDLSPA